MGIGSRLQILLDKNGETPIQLAKAIGIPEQTIYSLLKRDSKKVSIDTLLAVCSHYDVSADFFSDEYSGFDFYDGLSDKSGNGKFVSKKALNIAETYDYVDDHGKEAITVIADVERKRFDDDETKRRAIEKAAEDSRKVETSLELLGNNIADNQLEQLPLYDMPATAGLGNLLDDSPTFKLVYVEMGDIPHGSNILIKISGDSMEPEYNDGDIVYVHTTLDLRDGDVGIFVVDGDSFLKEFVKDGRKSKLRSYNPEYKDMDLANYTYCRPVGRVLGVCKGIRE